MRQCTARCVASNSTADSSSCSPGSPHAMALCVVSGACFRSSFGCIWSSRTVTADESEDMVSADEHGEHCGRCRGEDALEPCGELSGDLNAGRRCAAVGRWVNAEGHPLSWSCSSWLSAWDWRAWPVWACCGQTSRVRCGGLRSAVFCFIDAIASAGHEEPDGSVLLRRYGFQRRGPLPSPAVNCRWPSASTTSTGPGPRCR